MGIFNKVKQAFGFGSDEYDDDDVEYGIDATVTPLRRAEPSKVESDDSGMDATPVPTAEREELPVEEIFRAVVAVVNESLPSFLKDSVDPERQQKILYNAVDEGVRRHIERVTESARRSCGKEWEAERAKFAAELNAMRGKLHEQEEGASEKERRLLSAERQRRAVNERVHDLENQIARLEAEKEQFELENRSLVNKMRVMNVTGDAPADTSADLSARIEEYEQQMASLKSTVDALAAERDSLAARLKDAANEAESLRLTSGMNDSMFSDLNSRASAAIQESAEKDKVIDSLNGQLASASDRNTDLVKQLKDALAENDILRKDLDEATDNLSVAEKLAEDIEQIEQTIERKNNKIKSLQDDLRRRDERINALEAGEASLRRTIDNNLRAQAEQEEALRARIAELEQQAATRDKSSARKRAASAPAAAPKISAIDEDLDNTDWLVATPPEGVSVKTSGVSDSDFGYQEPVKKPSPSENSAQMSLFE